MRNASFGAVLRAREEQRSDMHRVGPNGGVPFRTILILANECPIGSRREAAAALLASRRAFDAGRFNYNTDQRNPVNSVHTLDTSRRELGGQQCSRRKVLAVPYTIALA